MLFPEYQQTIRWKKWSSSLSINSILAVEPNIKDHKRINITEINDAIIKADIVTFLVGHDEFKSLNVSRKLDFCGILNNGE